MERMYRLGIVAAVLGTLTVGCGRGAILGNQETQREEMEPELAGAWVSHCEGNEVLRLHFEGEALTLVQEKYHDPECSEPHRTISQTGKYQLAHNFKGGILNAIVFIAGPEFRVAAHTDLDVDTQNGVISMIQNEDESVIELGMSPQNKREVTRENLRIRETKTLSAWKRNEPKALNRLQTEKLNAYGFGEKSFVDFGSRVALRYELDNGYLQINGPVVGGRVFTKP